MAKTSGGVPILGNNIYIGPGAKIFGKIQIVDGCKIGANAVVNKSFSEKKFVVSWSSSTKKGIEC